MIFGHPSAVRRWAALLLGCLIVLAFPGPAHAAPDYPALTGRVVDQANLLDATARDRLETRLAAHEAAGGDQVVVVTLKALGGESIEEYGVGLGRHWGIGQEGKDNGVLLIVAPEEREVRIEVGYGLEGTLTDAVSSQIIQNEILPRFRSGDMAAGIVAGADAIVAALGGAYHAEEWSVSSDAAAPRPQPPIPDWAIPFLFFGAWAIIVFFVRRHAGRRGVSTGIPGVGGLGGGRLARRGGGFSGRGGGFSGRGGSFGGGGATGRW